jgi:hypothetical protein
MATNPLLQDPEIAAEFQSLPPEAQQALVRFCDWLYRRAARNADGSWQRKKGPMAVYWSAVRAWSYHIARLLGASLRTQSEKPANPSMAPTGLPKKS